MSQENVEAQRRIQDAYARGDYQPSIQALDEEVELWVDPRTNPEAGEFRGRVPSLPGGPISLQASTTTGLSRVS